MQRRNYRTAACTDDYLSLSLMRLKKQGYLAPGAKGVIYWAAHGKVVAAMYVRSGLHRLHLSYPRVADRYGLQWESYYIALASQRATTGASALGLFARSQTAVGELSRCMATQPLHVGTA